MKSIIITGANSGIGFKCALQMAKIATNEQIILACRNVQAGNEAIQIIKNKTGHQNLKCLQLDLASLKSIRQFASTFSKEKEPVISALVNNAGIQNIGETEYTADGFEITFGTNHLGPFALTQLLLPFMDNNASITFTASDTHDPLQKTGIEPPVYKSANELAYPKETNEKKTTTGQRRYSTSKLSNVLTVYSLQQKLANTKIRVNAFDPGLTPGTGLAKNYPAILRFVWKNIMPSMTLFKRNTNTPSKSGTRLANLAFSKEFSNLKGIYFSDGKVVKSSVDS
ncbi:MULTISPECIES: SDR family NAD(P)-dependent oxidoreductase [Flavobacterium]|uniref:NAD(P)-dependent dehydrogenase (Short-subunit alcohol dehydrogenase family) n=1 Tax=Flavobacterium circumlabens TaxID=2133765 RepID=A0ABY2B113_9FLAO|nr:MULTISPECIES: SDR family NAD(P)-dependent oxidoreductase [Flavobacterium]TCN59474.1 NAD(P)-dependent dehydrogenase (short-subunit alcohol dehydrogenase family) [Flavobacterium circumlabens]